MLMSALKPLGELENPAEFTARHIGPYAADEQHMLSVIGAASAARADRGHRAAQHRAQRSRWPARAAERGAGAGRTEGWRRRTGC
jgi:hypothetical protein